MNNTFIGDVIYLVEKEKILKINYLARKSKESFLTDEEKAEQAELRNEYRNELKSSFKQTLDNTYILDDEGNKSKLIK